MRRLAKVVLIIMSISSIFNTLGCQKQEDDKTIIERALKEKYNQEFVLDRIGGNLGEEPLENNKGYAYSVDEPNRLFSVQINTNTSKTIDSYMDVLMAIKQEEQLRKTGDEYFNNISIRSRFNSYWLELDIPNKDILPTEYMELNGKLSNIVFLISEPKEKEIEVFKTMVKEYIEMNRGHVSDKTMFVVIYIDDDYRDEMIKDIDSFTSLSDFLTNSEEQYSSYSIWKVSLENQ